MLLKVGDIVALRSGSPEMTIVKVIGAKVWTSWFVGEEQNRSLFPKESLVKVKQSRARADASASAV